MSGPVELQRGSFFKLIDTLALEIGELKMGHSIPDLDEDSQYAQWLRAHGDMDYDYQKEEAAKCWMRDSGYESFLCNLSIFDRLLHTHPVWLHLSLSDEDALRILQPEDAGIFLVRRSCRTQKKIISMRLPESGSRFVQDFPIKESQYTFSLEGSCLSFADLFRLIAFYCISRDVLPFPLKLPHGITAAKTETELEAIAFLGLEFWSSPVYKRAGKSSAPPTSPLDAGSPSTETKQTPHLNGVHSIQTRTPSELECSQTNGALCFINPLFLEVHSKDINGSLQGQAPKSRETGRPYSAPARPPPPRLPASMDQSPGPAADREGRGGPCKQPGAKAAPIPPPRIKKQAGGAEAVDKAAAPKPAAPGPEEAAGQGRQRLSDLSMSTTSTESDSSSMEVKRDCPSSLEGDTNSSLEEEEEEEDSEADSDQEVLPPPCTPRKKRHPSFVFPRIVKTHIQKVSGVFSSFMTPEKRMVKRIAEMSQDKRTYFGCLIQDYISFFKENKDCHVSSTDMLLTVRQFMTQVKSYLLQSSELDPPIESLIPEDEIDVVLEKAMHKCILKPLKSYIYATLKQFHVSDGSWKQLKENLLSVKQKVPQELGVDASVPDTVTLDKIRHKFHNMHKAYSPEKKVCLLLRVCKVIYSVMENNSGRLYGADDFLPMLTYIVAQCDMPELEIEIEYMMELLDPSLLHGEGGYYLTSVYGALSLIKNFQEDQAAKLLSSQTRNTLNQWHKRRTADSRTAPSVEDFQNYLRVAFNNTTSGCTAKTLLVRPFTTTEELCDLCAAKFQVQDTENYSLFLLINDTWQQLAPDTFPQKIKAELHSRPQSQMFYFVYKRLHNDLPSNALEHSNAASEECSVTS
ncbi:ras and Rab interactor 2-like isoform X1 [Chiloscyllium plagiosum]|uniref:ras and Rab interactor 2-like isoform X1 n=2 Tax=Chiloscyllium plagiosum TaxID=36176 RepID=UPI001CB823D6|nr:ras and Rab interactor 2-like isoform X1 [Chiloscyllium plagiosum]XP_043552456.1 ras and Rab interactor 2-like isoform X1 [Chiloscyllium plagiosum]XP_043552457.1 ras and Rab interactor 2-like isoform X1 [Chiloscyllium plagiosum]